MTVTELIDTAEQHDVHVDFDAESNWATFSEDWGTVTVTDDGITVEMTSRSSAKEIADATKAFQAGLPGAVRGMLPSGS